MFRPLHEKISEEYKKVSESTIQSLVGELELQGYRVLDGQWTSMSSDDIADAWREFREGGPEAAASYLETMFAFVIEKV